MVRLKTISLDEKTAIIAGRMPNFSRWVRERLIEYARTAAIKVDIDSGKPVGPHIAPPQARVWGPLHDKCNPRHRKGVCSTCYLDGVDA